MSEQLTEWLFRLTKYLLTPLLFVGLVNAQFGIDLARHFPKAAPVLGVLSDIVVAAPLAAGMFVLMFGVLIRALVAFMHKRAITLDATVVEVRQEPFKPEKYDGRKTISRPFVAFQLDGAEHQVALQSAGSQFDALSPGETLSVRVQPDEPDNVDLADSGTVIPWVIMVIGAGLTGFFAWAMQPGWIAWLLALIVVAGLYKKAYSFLQGKIMQA